MNALVLAPLHGEILGAADVITVTAAVHPLKTQAEILILPAGLSLAEIVAEVGRRCHVSRLARGADVSIDGHMIDAALLARVRVKAGAHVMVRARAGKGMGNILKSLLMIALAVAAAFIVGPAGLNIAAAIGGTAGQVVASLACGSIMTAGSIVLNALFPPSQNKSSTENQSYSIAAGRNGVAKWGPIPSVLGKVRAHPKYAALPYTEFDGDDQYLRMLFVWGYGPMKIEDIRIGDTSIDDFEDVEIETFEGYADDGHQTLYPAEVVQEDLSIEPDYNVAVTRASADDANEIVIDLVAPAGIGHMSSKSGKFSTRSVEFKVEMRAAGSTGAWTTKGTVELSGKSNDVLRRSFRYQVAKGRYDVRITRLTADSDSSNDFDTVNWTAIKTFRTAPPIDFRKPLAVTAIRIRATKQLNGVVDNLNGLVTTVAKCWTGSAWAPGQQTRNPADLFRHVLQGPANARPQPDSRIDLSSLAAWADLCTTRGYTFDMYRDFTASVRDTLRDIAAAGRAVPAFKDGKWSVAWEDSDAPVIQHFTPRNSRDFRWTQSYRTLPHGLRCKFVNAEKDYIEDEILVFDEGYAKENATLYEQAEFPGVTSTEIIYKHGLYRIADARERPAVYTLTVDFEHLVAQRADRVAVGHDVIEQGIASGRIKAVNGQMLTLDEPAVMEAGKLYGIRIRRADGTSIVRQATTVAGEQSVITIAGAAPTVGDLYTFGLRGHETGIYRILRIRPGADLSAEIDLVDDGANVQAGDDATDIPGGTVTPPAPTANYTPFGLRAESVVIAKPTGSIHVVRIYWQAVAGPEYVSFEVVGSSDQGVVREVVDGATLVAEFQDVQSGIWAFTVRGLFRPDRYTLTSPALVVPIDVPYDDLGVAKENLAPVVRDLLDQFDLGISTNTDAIAAEATERAAAISAQADALAAEVDDRVAAVTAQADALAQEVSDRSAAVAGERTDRLEMGRTQALDLRSLRDTVSAAALQISDLYLKSATDQVTMRKEIVVSEGNARAYSDSQLTLAVGPTSALAAQLSTLQASIVGVDGDLDAAITSLSEAIADGDAGEASARQALELQVRGSYAGADLSQVTEGLIYQANQAMISETQALSTAIELVSAGVGILFDWSILWSYNTDAEGWTGNGTPTVSNGWLRPANHATDPYVVSPDNLNIDGNAYRQIKLRIRKNGTPAWQGQFWWQGEGDTTWDSSRRATLAEPSYVDNIAVITIDLAWSGTIKRIREDLSSVQDASNYFEIDWNSIGRPSPGASQAQVGRVQEALSTALAAEASDREALSTILVGQADPTGLTLPTITGGLVYDEKSARIDGDSALSTLITGVQNSLDDQAGDIDALTTAQTTMQTAIDTLGDQVTLNASNIDDVEASLEGKADAAVTDALSAEIKTMGGGAVASQVGQALRDVRLKLDKLALANFDLFATGQQQRLDLSGALVNVQQALTGRIDTTDGSLSLLGQAVTAIQLALPDYATLDVTNILDGRVTATESSLTSAGSAITAIQAELPNKASVSAVEAAQDAADAAQADADAANMLVSTKADATALDSLAATVSSQGGTITSQGSALTSLSNSLEATNGNVTAAQSAADAAQAAANAAQTSADSKSDVLFQSATPGAGYQNGKTLWIDTAGNANTPKRWNGSNWVTATDKVATDAAAAATSAQAAADAANALAATKASTEVTDDLQSQIMSGAGGSTALAQTLRAVKASIDRLALSQFDLFTGGARQRIDLANIVASVNQSLTSRVDVTDGSVAVVVGRVDRLDAAIPGLATLGVTDALAGRIDLTEAGLEQVGESLLEINNTLDGKADASVLNDYYTKTQTDGVATTAASNATTALASSLAPQIAAAQAAADDAGNLAAANASALLNIYTKTETDGAVATAIAGVSTDFQSKVDEVSAAGKFRVATQATSAGAETTIGLIAEATSGATTHTAGLLIDALSSGKSRIIALGDQFIIADPANLANLKRLAVFEDGKGYLDEIYVRYLKADELEVDGRIDAAALLQGGSLVTDLMGYNAVADKAYGNLPLTGSLYYSDWTDVLVLPCDNPNPAAVLIEYSLTAVAARAQSGSGVAVAIVRLIRKDSGGGVEELARVQANGPALSSDTQTNGRMIMDLNGTRGSSYRIQLLSSGATGGSSWKAAGYIKLAWNKR